MRRPTAAISSPDFSPRSASSAPITALMFVTMVLAALVVNVLFSALGLIPSTRPSTADVFSTIELNYKAALNALATVVFVALLALTRRRTSISTSPPGPPTRQSVAP